MGSGLTAVSQDLLYMPPAAHSHFQLNSRQRGLHFDKIMIRLSWFFVVFFFSLPKETRGMEGSPGSMMRDGG